MRLLLVEDDSAMQTALGRALEHRGIHVRLCASAADAQRQWRQHDPDVVALDLSLPDGDGLEVLARARAEGLTTPVLILTARASVGDRVVGLNVGADDYLTKPFDLDELEARLRALVRRHRASDRMHDGSSLPSFTAIGLLRRDDDSGAIYWGQRLLELTPRENALLAALLERPGLAVAKERLTQRVFDGESTVAADAIEVVVYRVRRKLAGSGVELVTLRGLGYLLKESP